jgi:hypothetical protein
VIYQRCFLEASRGCQLDVLQWLCDAVCLPSPPHQLSCRRLTRHPSSPQKGLPLPVDLIGHAVRGFGRAGDAGRQTLQWLIGRGQHVKREAVAMAVKKGSPLALVAQLDDCISPAKRAKTDSMCKQWLHRNDIDGLRWALDRGYPLSDGAVMLAAKIGNIRALEAMWHHAPMDSAAQLFSAGIPPAVRKGRIGVLQWMDAHGCPWSDDHRSLPLLATKSGHRHVLRWMHRTGVLDRWDIRSEVISEIARSSTPPHAFLVWALDALRPAKFEQRDIVLASCEGHPSTLLLLRERGFDVDMDSVMLRVEKLSAEAGRHDIKSHKYINRAWDHVFWYAVEKGMCWHTLADGVTDCRECKSTNN